MTDWRALNTQVIISSKTVGVSHTAHIFEFYVYAEENNWIFHLWTSQKFQENLNYLQSYFCSIRRRWFCLIFQRLNCSWCNHIVRVEKLRISFIQRISRTLRTLEIVTWFCEHFQLKVSEWVEKFTTLTESSLLNNSQEKPNNFCNFNRNKRTKMLSRTIHLSGTEHRKQFPSRKQIRVETNQTLRLWYQFLVSKVFWIRKSISMYLVGISWKVLFAQIVHV